MIHFLLIGAIGYTFGKSKKRYISSYDKGIIFNCSSIKITNKTKFYNYIDSKILENFNKNKMEISDFSRVDLSNFILDLFQQINITCYNKFLKNNLNSYEKFSVMIFFEEIINIFRMLIVKNYLDYELFDYKIRIFVNSIQNYLKSTRESEDFLDIYNNFKITYKYP